MKITLKTLMSLLMITVLPTAINADDINITMKKQCQYMTYGNGKNDPVTATYMFGMVNGTVYAVPTDETKNYAYDTSVYVMVETACKNALNNRGKYGFKDDFNWQVLKLVSKRYGK